MRAAILVLSDKGAAGQRVDKSGPALKKWLSDQQIETVLTKLIPDDLTTIQKTLIDWCDNSIADLIITCGGTGISPRDVTPEATKAIIERELPGFAELMRAKSLAITPMAILSRAVAGIRNSCLILNLPGSPKAALENLTSVWPAIPHGLAKIKGDPSDCAGIHLQQACHKTPPVVSFSGFSGCGKTTLVVKVIRLLSERGYKVGAIKHDGHHFDIDKEGKDSWRMTQAGAVITAITDSKKLAVIKQHETSPGPQEMIKEFFSEVDIVIIEGWKELAPNRIEVYRKELGHKLLCAQNEEGFIALATNTHIDTKLPQLDINNPQHIVTFIIDKFLKR
ncbi:molybdopterin-guanine dinucleotide biosynthesis protein MobB [Desulfuromusa kysingii]|uniref:Molybdopterin-guanine dinucleotide biosynthesis protein MobB n=1 Tax=Desulfuromusa kysingii TaxID=37625 RepID=A0A1H4A3E4_9BACT|nr:molybdopterin-guanine dinucleotide biosynthesis protein B [Desulfuromusa kysingii]SEA30535.1 molybdopterin-guanine dinucleotide biosynthesis protein MobB [Desulfuromusa kysingii]